METERDEMFRLTRIRLAQFQIAKNLGLPGRGLVASAQAGGSADMGSKAKKGKKDKPNPCQPSTKKKDVKEKPSTYVADKTPAGEKKDSTLPMLADYHPKSVEAAWYAWWEKKQYFHVDPEAVLSGKKKAYVKVIPPPNVTGALHLGHALMLSIEDCIMRWRRMSGYETLWLPGVDHAGIATQSVVEKQLWKNEKKTRHDYGREAFVEKVWEWKGEYGGRIVHQFKRFGISVDWDRFAFTLDEQRSKAVTEAFVRMFEKGLIYRDTRLVNWSCALRTAISDLEVESIELDGPTKMKVPGHDPEKEYEFGTLTHFTYKVKGSDEYLQVATTRLETMLGDVAVAVHPDDARYKHLHGKELEHPFVKDRKIVVVTDGVLVDMAFGTGAVKITPAHDKNDFACGKRHNLPEINILGEDGKINHIGGKQFAGMARFDARIAVYEALDKLGQIKGVDPNPMRLGVCSKSGDIIEPYLKPQWWVDCKDMAKRSTDAVRNGDLKIVPADPHEATWFRWLDNIQDWCISRQLWWGHRIPCYLVTIPGKIDHPDGNNHDHWVVGRNVAEATATAAKKFGVDASKVSLSQDEDVLDTWFSSGLFPFATMGWPDADAKDLKAFFPGDLLETGHDILFFWVARMVMMSLELTDKLPFHTVFLHPMVKDENGAKMSKSKGNVIDPLEVMDGCELQVLLDKLHNSTLPAKEIEKAVLAKTDAFPAGVPECGTDALRFALLSYMVSKAINLDVKHVVGYRKFCNKLWNVNKFALMQFADGFKPRPEGVTGLKLALPDKWILTQLAALVATVDDQFERYDFGHMMQALHNFWLEDLASNYIEAVKPVMQGKDADAKAAAQNTLYICLDTALRLLHPTMPYLTEELFQRLPHGAGAPESICIAEFPTKGKIPSFADDGVGPTYTLVQLVVGKFNSQLADLKITRNMSPTIYIRCSDPALQKVFEAEKAVFTSLIRSGETNILSKAAADPEGCVSQYVNEQLDIYVKVAGLIDMSVEVKRIEKRQAWL